MNHARLQPVSRSGVRRRTGFTLVEMLIVVIIVVVLLSLVAGASIAVVRGQRVNATKNMLAALDRVLEEYIVTVGAIPPFDADDYDQVPGPDNALRAFEGDDYPQRPDAAVFLCQVKGYGEADSIVKALPEQSLQTTLQMTPAGQPTEQPANNPCALSPSVVDSWASDGWISPYPIAQQQVIYYVHPDNLLAQATFGRCKNKRPYFVSAGADKKYGFRAEVEKKGNGESAADFAKRVLASMDDNLYSYQPDPADTSETFLNTYR